MRVVQTTTPLHSRLPNVVGDVMARASVLPHHLLCVASLSAACGMLSAYRQYLGVEPRLQRHLRRARTAKPHTGRLPVDLIYTLVAAVLAQLISLVSEYGDTVPGARLQDRAFCWC